MFLLKLLKPTECSLQKSSYRNSKNIDMKLMLAKIFFPLITVFIASSSFAKAPVCQKNLSEADLNALSKNERLSAYCSTKAASQLANTEFLTSKNQIEKLLKTFPNPPTESFLRQWTESMSKHQSVLVEKNQCTEKTNQYYQSFQAKFGYVPDCTGK